MLGDFDRQQDTILIHSPLKLHPLESIESIGLQAPQRILYRRPHRRYWMTFTRLSDGRPLWIKLRKDAEADTIKHEHTRF